METFKLDEEIVKLSEKKKPNLLLLPTASTDGDRYYELIHKLYGEKLGCSTDVLYLYRENPTDKEIMEKFRKADIIYVGGGNTLKMLGKWKKRGVVNLLHEAWERGCVMSGVSAGSICWFRFGISDSRRFINPKADLIRMKGMNFINALHAPHYDVELDRKPSLKRIMKRTPGVSIAIDNRCAVEFVNEKYRVISDIDTANAYKTYWKRGEYFEEKLEKDKWLKTATLLKK